MNEIKVEIVADSINQQGDRLTSLVLTYPRIIHAEMMTHRMFSRNASSSRAVPIQKMIEAVKNNTFCPFEFQKAHKGMQGSEYFTGIERQECINLWLESAELALQQAEKMKAKGISKQIINRILEPYQYYTVLITGSKEGWDNFFNLRLPSYEYGDERGHYALFNSRKEYIDFCGEDIQYIPESEVGWLSINKGQAEIHMMALAESIYDAVNESIPKQLQAGEWHIPFEDNIHLDNKGTNIHDEAYGMTLRMFLEAMPSLSKIKGAPVDVKISTAMAARTSYTVVGEEKEIDYENLISLHDRLLAQDPPHSSPLEHCARAMSDEEYVSFIKGVPDMIEYEKDEIAISYLKTYEDSPEAGWCNNLKGFIPYRYFIDNKIEL